MSMDKTRAYCAECKRMVTDDLMDGKNYHEHPVVILRITQTVEPGASFRLTELSPQSYLMEASRLDAELIAGRIMSRYNIPLPKNIFRGVIEEILRILREVAIDEEKKERSAKAALLNQKWERARGVPKPKPKPPTKKARKLKDFDNEDEPLT